ncbi:blue copper protein-like [Cucumis melo var. makuwa]|uniref:Blue copper protein-like n=1 Tax=Cucumis melo var. makuwa TaxID=1194695 RepID=A0A5A7THQ1_CUCMM|nr:blue copper protein-like [Cucumis melo var. makuwa]
MANYSHLFLLFVTFFVPQVLAATNYTVGDKSGWNLGVDYFSWTSDKTFFVGDSLVFKYEKGKHNVLNVDVSSFSQCAAPKDQPPMVSGNDVITLTTPGTKWFICTIPHHCNSGQKLVISVDSAPPSPIIQSPLIPPFAGQPPPPTSSLPPVLVPDLPPVLPPTSPPSVPSPPQNQTAPHLPIAPMPTQTIPPVESPAAPSPITAAPPPSGAALKSVVSGHLGFLAMAVSVLAGIMI